MTADVTGLTPNAEHGFHVHENGDCSSGDGMSTGGHFNPDAKPHGAQGAAASRWRHASLMADANGVAKTTFTSTRRQRRRGAESVVGRGLIVHKDPDDFRTQPTGNAGARIAAA